MSKKYNFISYINEEINFRSQIKNSFEFISRAIYKYFFSVRVSDFFPISRTNLATEMKINSIILTPLLLINPSLLSAYEGASDYLNNFSGSTLYQMEA